MMKPSISTQLVICSAGLSLAGLLTATFFPAVILPQPDVPLYVFLTALACRNHPPMEQRRDWIFQWLVSTAALSLLPACAGIAGSSLLRAVLSSAVFCGATMMAFDAMTRRAAVRRTGKRALIINGLLLVLAVQGFQHMFL